MFAHHPRLPKNVTPRPAALEHQLDKHPDLLAAWPDPAGDGIGDIVGGLDVASLPAGVTKASTPYGIGLDLAGSGQVSLGVLATPADYTIFALVQHGTQSGLILHNGGQGGIGLAVTPNGAFAVAKVGGETKGNLIPLGAGTDEWYAVALTVAGAQGTIYVNGKGVWQGEATAGASGTWRFGDGTFDGRVADARIYSRALTADELTGIQEGPNQWDAVRKPPPEVPPKTVWRRAAGYGRRTNRARLRGLRR